MFENLSAVINYHGQCGALQAAKDVLLRGNIALECRSAALLYVSVESTHVSVHVSCDDTQWARQHVGPLCGRAAPTSLISLASSVR